MRPLESGVTKICSGHRMLQLYRMLHLVLVLLRMPFMPLNKLLFSSSFPFLPSFWIRDSVLIVNSYSFFLFRSCRWRAFRYSVLGPPVNRPKCVHIVERFSSCHSLFLRGARSCLLCANVNCVQSSVWSVCLFSAVLFPCEVCCFAPFIPPFCRQLRHLIGLPNKIVNRHCFWDSVLIDLHGILSYFQDLTWSRCAMHRLVRRFFDGCGILVR